MVFNKSKLDDNKERNNKMGEIEVEGLGILGVSEPRVGVLAKNEKF